MTSLADDWRPATSLVALRRRARIMAIIRRFFAERGVLEVETPLLSAAAASSPHLASFTTPCRMLSGRPLYLQTSPESAMKRLLAAGSGPIFQICKAFRQGEQGFLHNPEFTLLEWYRPGFSSTALMAEAEALLRQILSLGPVQRLSYQEAFRQHAQIDPFRASTRSLREYAIRVLGIDPQTAGSLDQDDCLDLILTHRVQPALGSRATWLYDFPAHQAQLARVRQGNPAVADRFELFVAGVELANGYGELTDSELQRQRFLGDQAIRRRLGLDPVPLDGRLLEALRYGLPECSGIALGVDRLIMVAAGERCLEAVLAFPISRA